eukprot:TRINITY_DN2587_c0_g1_i6.p2 TRINITY_DN2587_c0_g1~~TRINITY_DN2587_c0_g1_i6.p2  ORF type:complete len:118 (-),score=29.06 TRINITY_DN2587_c0_g1_i6:480-833(-)
MSMKRASFEPSQSMPAAVPDALAGQQRIHRESQLAVISCDQWLLQACQRYPRGGRGVEELCVDVGLEDPQSKKMKSRAAAELGNAKVVAGKLELLEKLKHEGLLDEEQFKAQQGQLA